MKKEDKSTVIEQIAATLKEYSHFYLTETSALNAEKTSALRRECFKNDIKMLVVKNALLHKAMESLETDYSPLYDCLKGSTTIMFSNTGNAPAIFGEIFQLLDRKDEEEYPAEEVGESEYGISNYEVAKEVYGDEKHQVRIPSNMFILATMNTADQNVFTLDTAFQRRWNMRQIENNFDKSEHSKDIIAGTKVSWGAFATVINDMVIDINVDMASSEDKRLGTYFAKKKELEAGRFSEKVLKYLWDDAFKMDKTAIFNENCKSLEDVVITYETATSDKLAAVLRVSVYEKMLSKMQQKNTDNNEN